MEAWRKLGAFVSGHMVLLVPVCLAAGIFLPDVLGPLRVAVPALFAFVTFQSALKNDLASFWHALAHPVPMLVTLFFVHVVVPLVAFAVARLLFGDDPDTVCGIVLEYAVPIGASMVMWVGMYGGSTAMALSTLLISTSLSPFTIPLTLHLLVGATVELDVMGMIIDMLLMIGLPAIAGLVLNELTHGWAGGHLSEDLGPLARLSIPLIIAVNATSISEYMLHLDGHLVAVMAFIGVFAVVNFLAGIAIAQATHQPYTTFVTMVFGCGMRNISAGAVIATRYFPPATVFPAMIGTLFQQLLAAAFGAIVHRVLVARHGPDGDPTSV